MSELKQLRAQVLSHWHALSARERLGLSVLGTLLLVCLFWSVMIAPALNTLRESEVRRLQIDQQESQMLALQQIAQSLQTRTPLPREEALRNLQGLTPSTHIQLNVQGERIAVQLKAIPASVLTNWLTQARNQAQVLPIEAHLTRSNATDVNSKTSTWEGNLVMSLPRRSVESR